MPATDSTIPVLVVGAGPTGLVLALCLAARGVPFRIVDRGDGPGRASRAMVVQARTLELYQRLGIADVVVARGIRVETARFHEGDREVARFSLKDIGQGISPFPFALCFPQDDHERLLVERLEAAGVTIGWGVELRGFEERAGGTIRSTLAHRDGTEETCEAAHLCGCDGARSLVRRRIGHDFPGGTYDQLFYVADVRIDRPITPDLLIHVGGRSLALILPVRSSGMHRLIGVVPPEKGDMPEPAFEDVRPSAEGLLGVRVREVNWFSTYRVHHRVAGRFRSGSAYLCGDAGHLHSPAGGQGMNTGIGDAVNLAWKLADVVQGRAAPVVLDSYEPERIAFARKLVETTDRAFQGMTGEGWTGRALRGWIVPHLLPALSGVGAARRALFRTVSQTRITYRDGPISEGRAGEVRGGDRLPWTGGNYGGPQAALDWRLHVYGEPTGPLRAAAASLGVAVDAFPWDAAAERAGLARRGAYLVRPDGHVALAAPASGGADALRAYAGRIGLVAATSPAPASPPRAGG